VIAERLFVKEVKPTYQLHKIKTIQDHRKNKKKIISYLLLKVNLKAKC
jgi:hypothetical protein